MFSNRKYIGNNSMQSVNYNSRWLCKKFQKDCTIIVFGQNDPHRAFVVIWYSKKAMERVQGA